MLSPKTIHRASSTAGTVFLGNTLPALLDAACDRHPNPIALNQWAKGGWQSLSTQALQAAAEELALGFLGLGLQKGDRIAFLMHSDTAFCIADMGSLLAGLINVPIDLTQTLENIELILQHSGAKALVVADVGLLQQVQSVIPADLWVIVDAPDLDFALPSPKTLTLAEVRTQGRQALSEESRQQLRQAIAPDDLATIIYIPGPTQPLRGVMLSHENISATILAAFSSFPGLQWGPQEVALSFLPLTHIFARAFLYGHLHYGHSLYFSSPRWVIKHLRVVQPTIFITVPRLLEKVYEKLLERGRLSQTQPRRSPKTIRKHLLPQVRLSRSPSTPTPSGLDAAKLQQMTYDWALKLAQQYELGQPIKSFYAWQLKLADRLVYHQWRAVFGGRLKALICGGAALKPEVANLLSAAKVPVLQGYGLTESSSVLAYNRGDANRAGTVGLPIPGVEVAIAPDQEVLVKAPYVMQGYYRDPIATREALSSDGWLHTGDLGEIGPDGFLKITGIKKNLFKLTTGKYVTPQPLEQQLEASPLVNYAIAVGANQKFCGMLIFPNLDELRRQLPEFEACLPEVLLQHPCAIALYQSLIDQANCHLPYWSTVRKFQLINTLLSSEDETLTPAGSINRINVTERFAKAIEALYWETGDNTNEDTPSTHAISNLACPVVPVVCPTAAQSLMHY